jgi:hypothetical protein
MRSYRASPWRAWQSEILLVIALAVLVALVRPGPFRSAMLIAIPLVVAWSFATLHMPTRVDVGDEGIAFFAWGRAHRFAWRDVDRVYVRRFMMKDRVLVRFTPSSAFRGRYWILDSIAGFSELVEQIERLQPPRGEHGTG